MSIEKKKKEISYWITEVSLAKSLQEKVSILAKHKGFKKSKLSENPAYLSLSLRKQFVIQSLIVIGEFENLSKGLKNGVLYNASLLDQLEEVESFCSEIQGILGYQLTLLNLISKKQTPETLANYFPPNFVDISTRTPLVNKAIRWGLEDLPKMGEIYVLGGAADRLHLQHPVTHREMPAAMLKFTGKTLLEILINDLKAKENLYEKVFHKKIITPIAVMTSYEKNNHEMILELLEKNNWFERPPEYFKFFTQPSVPVIDISGNWIINSNKQVLMKPGGHGALWKLAKDQKVFQWMKSHKRKKGLIRQINNPIAGTDYGLLAFTGWGLKGDLQFGFASCARRVNAQEGVNVLVERRDKNNSCEYFLSNIEYCEFEKYGIEDKPFQENGIYSRFSSNTNILFADFDAVEEKVAKVPFPGMLVNFKNIISSNETVLAGRLETTMQNIADAFTEKHPKPLKNKQTVKTFVTYNDRAKTISTTKKVFKKGVSELETPEKCFYDLLKNNHELLTKFCKVKVEPFIDFATYVKRGPSFIFTYLPSLGPLYSIISQKLQRGEIHNQSELQLNISEVFVRNIHLKGSMIVDAKDTKSFCSMENFSVCNRGIDFLVPQDFWKGDISRKEAFRISLGKNSGIILNNLTIEGNMTIEVPDNTVYRVIEEKGDIKILETDEVRRLDYQFNENSEIEVKAVDFCLL
ncbi:MAG: hypothetical protein COT84_07065 [Chlamydiae bacterium CG10_big_fil_rev_8_21_14_0_10_35_9]|nr:MAG: hypothetical protein COT84_07065 [Chlamydiae bacterium CG10_big_fil_rev_8_21_14_0_10_35_9]